MNLTCASAIVIWGSGYYHQADFNIVKSKLAIRAVN